jgi:hypothetical protein
MMRAAGSGAVELGCSFPLAATSDRGGVNFGVFVKDCDADDDARPAHVVAPVAHSTPGNMFFAFLNAFTIDDDAHCVQPRSLAALVSRRN